MSAFTKPKLDLKHLPEKTGETVTSVAADVVLLIGSDDRILETRASVDTDLATFIEGWTGKRLSDTILSETQIKAERLLASARCGEAGSWRQVNHMTPNGDDSGFPVEYIGVQLEGSDTVLLLGRDLRNVAALQARLVKTQLAVEREYERFRMAESRYRELFELSSDATLMISVDGGSVLEANGAARRIFGGGVGMPTLVGLSFPSGVAKLTGAGWASQLDTLVAEVKATRRAAQATVDDFPLEGHTAVVDASWQEAGSERYVTIHVRQSDGLVEGSDGDSLRQFIESMPDAFLLIDKAGRVQRANQSFARLVDISTTQDALGLPFDLWLDQPGMSAAGLFKLAQDVEGVRALPLRLRGRHGASRETEASLVHLTDNETVWAGLLLRDTEVRISEGEQAQTDLEHAVNQMTHLVGRMSLKEIVRETTDVIERMCIEAALELTEDNRASAAEMLGISRQSLYVKLRRYGFDSADKED